jgi:hypothetical protein
LSTAANSSQSQGNEALLNQTPTFTDVPEISLAELCDRSYLNKQRKGRKASTGNIFPASMIKSKTSTNQTPRQIIMNPAEQPL